MKQHTTGKQVSYGKSIDELRSMVASADMKDFCLACDALAYDESRESYEIMRSYLDHKDKYRRLYVMKTIFRHPNARELTHYLEDAILSDDDLFVDNGLDTIADFGVKISADALWAACEKSGVSIRFSHVRALRTLEPTEENYSKFNDTFNRSEYYAKIAIATIMKEKYLPKKAAMMFDLFAGDDLAEVRQCALEIAKEFGFDHSALLDKMRHSAKKLKESRYSFLSKYEENMLIDISGDLESVIIYNPSGGENIVSNYDTEMGEYTVVFSTQHVHLDNSEDAEEWIDEVINGNTCALEFFRDETPRFGGEISADKLPCLTYDALYDSTAFCLPEQLFDIANRFQIRDWTGKNNIDGRIFKINGKGEIEIKRV